MVDGHAGDYLTTDSDFIGDNGTLAVDADLSATAGVADQLDIDGTTSGHTGVVVNVTGFGDGGPNITGVPVVYAGTTHDGDFSLANGPVNAGFFAYDLFRDDRDYVLRAVGLGNAAFELPAGVSGAQNLWDESGDAAHQHILGTMKGGQGGGAPSPWLQGFGSWSKLDPTVSFEDPVSSRVETLNLDDSQTEGGILGGLDFDAGSVADGNMKFGVLAGYVTSALAFDATSDSWDYKGGTVGAYASYMKNGFFFNGLVKGDMLTVGVTDRQGAWSRPARPAPPRSVAGSAPATMSIRAGASSSPN